MAELPTPGSPPERLGPYRILDRLGEGGMGVVYLAYDEDLGRRVALKWLKQATHATVERLRQEAHLHARVEHPAVCRLYQVGVWEGWPYLVMQLVSGRTLDQVAPSLPLATLLRLMATLADGVHAAHRQGLIHRDLKPTNLMVEPDEAGGWRPYVMDFGLAREESSDSFTDAGVILGSPAYMAPEQVRGGWVDPRTDVYGLGAALFEALTGRPPFQGQIAELILQVQTQEPPRLRDLAPELPRDLEAVLQTCLARDPARRYPSAAGLRDDLLRVLDGEPVRARRISQFARLGHWIRRNPLTSGLAALAVAAFITAGLFWEAGQRRTQAQAYWAPRLGREAEHMEAAIYKAYSLPAHDIRPERNDVLAQIARIRRELAAQGSWPQAAGRLAIGRGLMALGRLDEARSEFEGAWRASRGRDPEIAQALGLSLARLYQRDLEGLRGQVREDRKKALASELLNPARELLGQAKSLHSESTAYVEAVLALVEEKPEQALSLAREAQRRQPWFLEAWGLEADIHLYQANARIGDGAFRDAEACLAQAGGALAQALAIGRSSPMAYLGELQRRMTYLQLRLDQGKVERQDLDWALQAVAQALKVDPDNWQVLNCASAIHRRWGAAMLEAQRDAEPALDEAIRCAEAGLRLRPSDTQLLNNLGTALRYKAGSMNERGADPRPTLARATEALQKAMDRPAFADYLLNNLGNCHALQATWELAHGADPRATIRQAATCFRKATALRPWAGHGYSEAMADLDAGSFLTWQDQDPLPALDAAVKAMEESLALNPNFYLSHRGMAEIRLARAAALTAAGQSPLEELRRAEAHLDQTLRLNPALTPLAQAMKARCAALRAASVRTPADHAEARRACERAAARPLGPDAALAWAEAVADMPQAPPALAAIALRITEQSHARRPWDARPLLLKGRLLLALGRKPEGGAALRNAAACNANLRPLARRLAGDVRP